MVILVALQSACSATLVLYHCHFLFYQQIFSEFNRIFEKGIIKDIKEVWSEMVPKIFNVTKNESNESHYMKKALHVLLNSQEKIFNFHYRETYREFSNSHYENPTLEK